ncbi:MAG TPA: DUF2147 domain-containing protein [Caulobacter sp.]|nr:DUF2147 domain-containing protein [Caulobacter sp.]
MRRIKSFLIGLTAAAGLAAGLAAVSPASAQDVPFTYGVWRNPKNSVHVEIKPCGGGRACGVVIWANDDAKADARKGGTPELVGLQLLRDFQLQKNGSWKGKVFVPDLNMNFNGTADFPDATTMKAKGCLIGGFLCKSQTWRRVDVAARTTPSS